MNTKRMCMLCVATVVILCASGYAEPFLNPPETTYPNPPGWQTQFPYQRNIYWDFAVDPQGGPSPGGTPGAVYEGTDDLTLRGSDVVSFSGTATLWYPSFPGTTRTGLVGIDNRQGTEQCSGQITFHVDNLEQTLPDKHVWLEYEFVFGGVSSLGWGTHVYPQDNKVFNNYVHLPDGSFLTDEGFLIQPNPVGEDVVLHLTVSPGTWLMVDWYHVATECVPEPGTLMLLALGGLGLFGRAVRRRRPGQALDPPDLDRGQGQAGR